MTLPGPVLIEGEAHHDTRGFFLEAFNRASFEQTIAVDPQFVQDNHSYSVGGVLRGLHYQLPPMEQGKLVRVATGVVFDVAVDIRRSSPTFMEWFGYELSRDEHRQLWIPPGFAHGFLVLSDSADVIYKTTNYFSPTHERALRWDDPAIAIEWPQTVNTPILSAKDASAPGFEDADLFD